MKYILNMGKMHNKIRDLIDKLYERLFSYLQWNSNNRYEKRYAFSYQLHCIKNTLVATGLKQCGFKSSQS